MDVSFNYDISLDDINMPPWENYAAAERLSKYFKVGNFIKKHWGRLKHQVTEEEFALNEKMRGQICLESAYRKPIDVDFSSVTSKDNVFWFRPSQCFANVIVPSYMLNGRQSNPRDRYQIIVTSYHAAIFDTQDNIIYDPSVDVVFELNGEGQASRDKNIATLGLLYTKQGLFLSPNGPIVGTLTLSEYLHQFSGKNGPLVHSFNDILGHEAIKIGSIGTDLRSTK